VVDSPGRLVLTVGDQALLARTIEHMARHDHRLPRTGSDTEYEKEQQPGHWRQTLHGRRTWASAAQDPA